MGWVAVVPLQDLPDGGMREFVVAGAPVLLCREGTIVRAVDGVCPHKFSRLIEGRLDGCRLTCATHTATFDVRDGSTEETWAGRLPTFACRVVEGVVEVEMPEW